jgi:DNA-binding transcriptional LysR family regulator
MFVLTKLAELGSMTRAAEATNMTQPAISVMVGDLERLVGVPLFLRHARGVKPTMAAMELLPVAKRIVAATADGAEAVSSLLNGRDGVVRIVASITGNGKLLLPFLPEFGERYPRIQVELSDLGPRHPLDLIAQQDYHLACIGKPATIPQDCTFRTLCEDRLVVVGGIAHPLSQRTIASQKDLAAYRWITTSLGTVAREQFEVFAERIALPLTQRCCVTTSTPSVLLELVSKHGFVALLPESVVSPWVASGLVAATETEASTPLPPLGLLWQSDAIPRTAETLIASLVEFSRSLGGGSSLGTG